MSLTNYERWQLMLRDEPSPQSFKDFSLFFLIAACLQRRVWTGGFNPNVPGQCLFPSQNTILVGPSGCGKGKVINPVNSCINYWKMDVSSGELYSDEADAREGKTSDRNGIHLFGRSPEDINIQALMLRQSKSTRVTKWERCRVGVTKPEETPAKYLSSPMHIILEEMNTLFHKDAKRLADYFLTAYDCNDVTKETVGRGTDIVKKPCLSLLAGTTPDDLQEQMSERLIGSGLTARVWFIYEIAPSARVYKQRPPDESQIKARLELLDHLKNLAFVYGRVELSQEADEWMKNWWENESHDDTPNKNPKLVPYYQRKVMHILKLSMALLFLEDTTTYKLELSHILAAKSALEKPEMRMHYALSGKGRNPLGVLSNKVLEYLFRERQPTSLDRILSPEGGNFYTELTLMEAMEVMKYLEGTGKVRASNKMYLPTELLENPKYAKLLKTQKMGSDASNTPGADLPALPVDIELSKKIPPAEAGGK